MPMRSPCADSTFGLSPQSLAVLHLIAGMHLPIQEPPKTTPWYNGLENGIAFVLQGAQGWRVILVGEDSRTDSLFIEFWDQPDRPFNAPTIEQREAEDTVRVTFKPGSIAVVAEEAVSVMRECLGGR